MKHQTSITIDEKIMLKIKDLLRDGTFRNQSHVFEVAIRKLIEDRK